MSAFLTFLFWRFRERNMSFRAWSGGRLEVLGAIWEMKHCQVGNGQLSLLYNAPLIAPLMDKQWGINFAHRLLHNRANIFFFFFFVFSASKCLNPIGQGCFRQILHFSARVCIYLPFSFRRGQPQVSSEERKMLGGEVRLCRKQFSGLSSYQMPADVPLWPSQEHGPWGKHYFPGLTAISFPTRRIRHYGNQEIYKTGIMETRNPRNQDPSEARGPWCKNLFPEPQGFRASKARL